MRDVTVAVRVSEQPSTRRYLLEVNVNACEAYMLVYLSSDQLDMLKRSIRAAERRMKRDAID